MNMQEFADLSAGYVLGALSPDDRDAFEAALAAHPEWSEIVRADAESAATLAETAPPVAPPLTMRGTLLTQIALTPQLPATPPLPPLPRNVVLTVETEPMPTLFAPTDDETAVEEPQADEAERADDSVIEPPASTAMIQAVSRRNWTRGLLALAASLVFLVVIGFGAASLGQWLTRPAAVIALEEIEAAPDALSATQEITGGGTATAHWSAALGKAVLVTDGLPSIPTGQTFELWFVRDDGTAVSAGTFDASGASTTAALDGSMHAGDVIAVSVEPAGGSTTGTPTTDPIVAIPTA